MTDESLEGEWQDPADKKLVGRVEPGNTDREYRFIEFDNEAQAERSHPFRVYLLAGHHFLSVWDRDGYITQKIMMLGDGVWSTGPNSLYAVERKFKQTQPGGS